MFGRRELIEKLAVFLGIAVAAKAATAANIMRNPGGDDELLAEMKSAAIAIRAHNLADKQAASDDIDQLRVQLAGCGVAASGWNQDPAIQGQWGWSASYQDVLDLRHKFEAAVKIIAETTPAGYWVGLHPCGCSFRQRSSYSGAISVDGTDLGVGEIAGPIFCTKHYSANARPGTIISGEKD